MAHVYLYECRPHKISKDNINGKNLHCAYRTPSQRLSTDTPPSAGLKAMRNGEGDASDAADSGRMSHNHVSVDWAAKFSRRRDSARTFDCHKTTAPHEPFFRICSADHSASAELLGRNHRTLRSFTCHARHVMEFGR